MKWLSQHLRYNFGFKHYIRKIKAVERDEKKMNLQKKISLLKILHPVI